MTSTDTGAHAPAAAEWWRGAVIYEIYIRSFQDTDGNGVGDLAGIVRHLPYVADLGVDAIWITPFFVSPMRDFGYDVADYTAVDPRFGTLADFDALLEEAHRLGLKVLIDQVLSHTSDQHPWFRESRINRANPKADWYVWADPRRDGTPPNNWLSIFGGPAWEWDTRRCQYYLHNFLVQQPDLNFHSPEVQAALLDSVRFWLDRGVDGFRLDTVNFYFHSQTLQSNPPVSGEAGFEVPPVNPYAYQDHVFDKSQPENIEFLRRLRALLDRYPGRTTMGEIGDGPRSLATMATYTSGGDRLHMGYTFELLGPVFNAGFVRDRVEQLESMIGDGWPCWSFSNHDVERHVSRWAGQSGLDHDRLARICAGVLLSLRGSACLYQGEELGFPEAQLLFEDLTDPYGIHFWPEYKGRDGCRTPIVWESDAKFGGFSTAKPWLPIAPAQVDLAVNRQVVDPHSTLALYRALLRFRRNHPALRHGTIAFLPAPDEVVAFVREVPGETIVCLFNLAAQERRVGLPPEMTVTALDGHGFAGTLDRDGDAVVLPAGEAFFGRAGPAP
jgi:alpha-glucosidase